MEKLFNIRVPVQAPPSQHPDSRDKRQVLLRSLTFCLAAVPAFYSASCAAGPEPLDHQASGIGMAGESPSTQGDNRFGPGYPAGSAAWPPDARAAYRTAFMAGLQDEREGYRYDEDRGAMLAEENVRGFYRKGYRRGYYHDAAVRRTRLESAAEESVAPEESPDGGQPAESPEGATGSP